jgi:hypothetical protein
VGYLTEEGQLVVAIVPIDLASGANNGDWVSMKGYTDLDIIVVTDAGTASEDPVLTVRQATDVAGTSAKALNFTRVDSKVGAQTGIGQFTKNTQAAANTYTDLVSGEAENLFVIHIRGEELDLANGFDCVQFQLPDTGATAGKFGCALYYLSGPRYTGQFPPSAIVD